MSRTTVAFRTPAACILFVCLAYGCNPPLPEGQWTNAKASALAGISATDAGTPDDCTNGVWCPPPVVGGGLPDAGEEDIVTVPVLGARGEFTSPSFLTSAPPGAALLAQNVVVDRPGEYTTARGFERLPAALPGGREVSAWTVYQGAVIAHAASNSTLYRYVSGTWTAYSGTYAAPSPGTYPDGTPIAGKVAFFETQQTLYFTTSLGMYRLEGVTETPKPAGVVQALPGVAAPYAAGQALSTNSATAYRYVWGRRATNGRIMLGAPSDRVTVTNRSESFSFNPSAVSKTSGVVTVTTTAGVIANLLVGQVVTLSDVDPADVAEFPEGEKVITTLFSDSDTGTHYFTYGTPIVEPPPGTSAVATDPGAMNFTTTATAIDVSHIIPIPEGVDASYFLQVYRSDEVPQNVEPSDEMFLVHEKPFAEMNPSATSYVFTDGTPDALKGDALYTNLNSGNGISAAHFSPPKGAGTAVFGNRTFYANVELRERVGLTVLAVGVIGGPNVGHVLTVSDGVSSFDYLADTVEDATTGRYMVYSDGTPAQNIANTVASLTRVINATTGGIIYAREAADRADALGVGDVIFESRAIASAPITVTASQSSPYILPALGYSVLASIMSRTSNVVTVNTPIPHGFVVGQSVRRQRDTSFPPNANFPDGTFSVASVGSETNFTYADAGANATAGANQHRHYTAGDGVQTDDEAAPGGFMVSDVANPDSVPSTLPEIVGDRYKRILFMVQVGSVLFFGKEDGLYRLSGTEPINYVVDCVDATIRFVAPRAVWVLNGRAYALTTQGLATWTESSTPQPAALQIEDQLRNIVETASAEVERYAFAVAHESKRRAYLFLPSGPGATSADTIRVYNATGDAWTRWAKSAVDAFIHPTEDRLWLAPSGEGGEAPAPARERNSGTSADYMDEDGNAIQALLTWTPLHPPEPTQQEQLVRTTYSFAGPIPTAMDVSYVTDWNTTPIWFTLDSEYSQSPGTMTTPPTMEHNRGGTHTLSVRHAVVGEPLRLLGFSAQLRFWTRATP